MKNRIQHVLRDWNPEVPPAIAGPRPANRPPSRYPLPRGVNMLMPVELGISRELLITLLSASILEMHRHRAATSSSLPDHIRTELEAGLQQQLAFRAWVRQHPSSYISIATYPTGEVGPVEDAEEPEDYLEDY